MLYEVITDAPVGRVEDELDGGARVEQLAVARLALAQLLLSRLAFGEIGDEGEAAQQPPSYNFV